MVPSESTNLQGQGQRRADLQQWDRDTLLRDGSVARIRPLTSNDAAAWRAFYSRLSTRSVYRRFLGHHARPSDKEVAYSLAVDYEDRMAFVIEQHDAIVGIGRYDRTDESSAEVAFTVTDDYQGKGVGTLLLEYLVAYARQHGIQHFEADTLAENREMLGVFRAAGFRLHSQTEAGVTRVAFDLTPNASSQHRIVELEWRADAESIRAILEPGSVAVIGARLDGSGIGNLIVANLRAGGYAGQIAAVNQHAIESSVVDGVHWCQGLSECSFPIDLAIVTVPAAGVPSVVDGCANAGVRAMVIISAGFSESGDGSSRLQDEVMERAHRAGIRVVGPNCLGIVNTDPAVSLNATFAAGRLAPGHVALASQSGAVGIALLERAHDLDISVSSFVSLGNKADVSGNDLLRYWHQDASTRVILLYLESLGNPRQFFDIARIVGRTKPIVVVKGGRTVVGARAAASHTASIASSDLAADTLFAQAGVIRASTLEEMLDLGSLLDHAPIPRGNVVAIVSNAGGAGVLAADAAEDAGLLIMRLPSDIQEQLARSVSGVAGIENPVDLGAEATPESFGSALRVLAQCPDVDAIIAIHAAVPHLSTDAFLGLVCELGNTVEIPVVAVTLGVDPDRHISVPRFAFPERAVRTLARVVRHGMWRQLPLEESAPPDDVDVDRGRAVVQRALSAASQGCWLDPREATELLASYGVCLVAARVAHTSIGAVEAAKEIGFPVALKADVVDLLHKSGSGAVALNVASAHGVETVMRDMRTRFGKALRGVVVQRMAGPGVELIVGAVRDPKFGPLILYGSGGTNAELFKDQELRLAPLTEREAHELVRASRGFRLLDGFRGQPPCDVPVVVDTIRRIAQLAFDIPEISEVECNPLIAYTTGAVAVDFRVHIEPAPPRAPEGVRMIQSARTHRDQATLNPQPSGVADPLDSSFN